MARRGVKLAIGLGAIAVSLSYLGFRGVRAGWVYYLSVDEYAAREEAQGTRSRVHGVVGEGAEADTTGFVARFELVGATRRVQVEYRGVLPDLFAAGREVVVEGVSDRRGVLVADVLLTKCGSKYAPAGAGE